MSSSLSGPQEEWHDIPQQPVPYINQVSNPYDSQANYAEVNYSQSGPYPNYYSEPQAHTNLFPFFPPFFGPFFPPFWGPFFPPFYGPFGGRFGRPF